MARYIAQPTIAEERLRLSSIDGGGNILYKLKREYSDGTSLLIFTPLEIIEKMAALVPPPRGHLTRFVGCLAPHAKIRAQIVPKPPEQKPATLAPTTKDEFQTPTTDLSKAARKQLYWAQLLARVFAIDMRCPSSKPGRSRKS